MVACVSKIIFFPLLLSFAEYKVGKSKRRKLLKKVCMEEKERDFIIIKISD